jgi:hypothetical protein
LPEIQLVLPARSDGEQQVFPVGQTASSLLEEHVCQPKVALNVQRKIKNELFMLLEDQRIKE